MAATLSDITLPDAALLARCRVERLVRGGPGGQHANRTASAIRLVHPSGISVEAGEHREGEANRRAALQRLRLRLACICRGADPAWLAPHVRNRRLACGPAARSWPLVAAALLDALAAHQGMLKPAAEDCGLSTTQFVRALAADPDVRRAADAIRAAVGAPVISG